MHKHVITAVNDGQCSIIQYRTSGILKGGKTQDAHISIETLLSQVIIFMYMSTLTILLI